MPGKIYVEIVSDEIYTAGYSVGVVGYIDLRTGRDMYAADANQDDGHRWIARADSELKAWIALKAMLWEEREL